MPEVILHSFVDEKSGVAAQCGEQKNSVRVVLLVEVGDVGEKVVHKSLVLRAEVAVVQECRQRDDVFLMSCPNPPLL